MYIHVVLLHVCMGTYMYSTCHVRVYVHNIHVHVQLQIIPWFNLSTCRCTCQVVDTSVYMYMYMYMYTTTLRNRFLSLSLLDMFPIDKTSLCQFTWKLLAWFQRFLQMGVRKTSLTSDVESWRNQPLWRQSDFMEMILIVKCTHWQWHLFAPTGNNSILH